MFSTHISDVTMRLNIDEVRERALSYGPATLSDAELVSIVATIPLDRARELFEEVGGLNKLASSDAETIASGKCAGPAKGLILSAAFELGRRAQVKSFNTSEQVRSPKDVADRYIPKMRDLPHEEFWVIHLNKANIIIRHVAISKGGVSASVVDAHEVFRLAILDRAASVILMHNHPSGNPEPSREDIALTRALVDAGAVLQLPVYDHIIVAGSSYTSLKERRLM